MAPIRVKWDPEILAEGFHPSSIFDEVEANVTMASTIMAPVVDIVDRVVALVSNTTTTPLANTSISSTTTAPAGVVFTGTTASPAANITAGLHKIMAETVRRVVDLTNNSTTSTPAISLTTPSWTITTPSTILKRAVEKVTTRPEVAVEHVSIFYIYVI